MIRAETADKSVSRPASFLRQSIASRRKGSSSCRARSASVRVNRRCGGSGSSGASSRFSSSSSAIRYPFRWGRAASAMLTQSKHPVEGNSSVMTCAFIDRNTVDDVTQGEVVECPKQMLRGNAEHCGTHANTGIERDNLAVRKFLTEPIYKVNLGAHRPRRARRG